MAVEFLRVVLHTGANFRAFNHFIGNINGYAGFEPTTDEFEVEKAFIDQATLDQFAVDYAADQPAADQAAQQANEARQIGKLQQEFTDDVNLNAVVEVMRLELNELRALHSLPDIPAGQMDGAIRQKITNP